MQIIFIHGSGGSGALWHYQTAYFEGSDAIDLPGHPDGKLLPTIEANVDWLKAYIERKKYEDVVLVGHSMGGAIAMLYALKYPGELRALILVGSGGRLRVHPDILRLVEESLQAPQKLVDMFSDWSDKVGKEVADVLALNLVRNGPKAYLNDFKACDAFDVMDRLPELKLPSLAIVGSEDVMTPPKYAHFMADKIEGMQVQLIDGGTHFVFAEYAVQVNRVIEGFMENL